MDFKALVLQVSLSPYPEIISILRAFHRQKLKMSKNMFLQHFEIRGFIFENSKRALDDKFSQ